VKGNKTHRKEKKHHFVHHSSFIEDGVSIGEGTHIWYFCHIRKGARIGKNCNIGQNVFIGRDVTIGNGVKIQNNVSVYESVTLEDHVFCGPSVVFTNVRNPRSEYPKKYPAEYGKTLVRRGATIGANATIVCPATIGRYAFVGAGSVVTGDVPAHTLAVGSPARVRGWICECGQRLRKSGGRAMSCQACGKKYTRCGKGLKSRETR
jgi:UDP-2-acetamido-3-amino-2,3-dideoxy-glucuronate N-acetyltransferase